jgi:pilus assembly protein CpaE
MAVSGEKEVIGALLWVTDGTAGRELLESAGRDFKLTVRICAHGELLERLRGERYDLVGIELGGTDPSPVLAQLREVHQRMPRLTIFAAWGGADDAVIRAALEAGAMDFLSLPLNAPELHKALIKFTATVAKAPGARKPTGEAITIYGARGGLGTTTIAVNLGFRLAALTSGETALVDLDLQRGDVAAFLNLTPLNSLATIASAGGVVDEIFLAGTLMRHPSGIFVLPAPPEIEEADVVGHGEVELALRLMRAQFRFTVVDTPRTITGATLAAFEQTDHIFILADLSVPGVRAARRTFELLDRLRIPFDHLELLVTEAVPGPVSLNDAARMIGKNPYLVIPRDDAAASAAMNGGTTLNGRQSSLAVAINDLAAKLAGISAEAKAKRGHLLQRIFTKEARK